MTRAKVVTPFQASLLKRRAKMRELHSLGIPGGVARVLLGMATPVWHNDCKATGLKFKSGTFAAIKRREVAKGRAVKMYDMYKTGMTLQAIGEHCNLTRERVRQLMTIHLGVNQDDGGHSVVASSNRQRRNASQDARYLEKYGCTFDQYVEVRSIGRRMVADGASIYATPLRAFIQQRNNSLSRGILWDLTFWQWWMLWQASGKWEQRGRTKNAFVMCRRADAGGYSMGNVFIGTLAENSANQPNNPYRSAHPDFEQAMARKKKAGRSRPSANMHRVNVGLPKGVTKSPGSPSYIAQGSINGKNSYLGSYPTPELAHAAYRAAIEQADATHPIISIPKHVQEPA